MGRMKKPRDKDKRGRQREREKERHKWEQVQGGGEETQGDSFSILVSHSARGEATVFQRCLHSLPVCREHPEDTV